jgi:hypothetical protein
MDSDLAEFAEHSFGSVWALELLLLLRRDAPRRWSNEELVQELRSSDAVVGQSVERLMVAGLVLAEDDGAVRYAPASDHQHALVVRLEEEYGKRPAAIRRLILQGPEKLRHFSEAFRLKRDGRS